MLPQTKPKCYLYKNRPHLHSVDTRMYPSLDLSQMVAEGKWNVFSSN